MSKKVLKKSLVIFLVLVLSLSTVLSGCSKDPATEVGGNKSTEGLFTPGTYEGEGKGFNGPIKVAVTAAENGANA